MSRPVIVLLLAVLFWMPVGDVAADFQKTKIAVLDFQLQGENFPTEDMGKIVAEWLITALVQEGRFEVVERRLLKKVLSEQKLVMTGVVDENSATQLGKLLGVKVIISGSVLRFQNIMEVNARIIDVESATIITAERVKSTTAIRLEDMVVQMAEKIIKDFPLEGYIVNRNNDIVTIDLGRRAGARDEMKFVVFKEGKMMKHPRTGEVLDVERIETGEIQVSSVTDKIAKATIIKEESTGAIEYGQMVKSIPEKIKDKKAQLPLTPAPSIYQTEMLSHTSEIIDSGEFSKKDQSYILMFRSPISKQKIYAAKKIFRYGFDNKTAYDVVEEELLKGYSLDTRDRYHIDAMSWLCKVLGSSKIIKYQEILSEVSTKAPSRKLRKHAKKSLGMLR